MIPLAFALFLVLGTGVLMLPVSVQDPARPADLLTAAFTAVSATCVTGLTVVDTVTYWSTAGQVAIMVMMQLGGFGIMTLATVLGFLVTGWIKLTGTLTVQLEGHAPRPGSVTSLLRTVLVAMVAVEAVAAGVLAAQFHAGYGYPWGKALWHGLFHSVSAFTNGSFALHSDNMMGFAGDWIVNGTLCLAIIAGGVGFPVFAELRHRWSRPRTLSLHVKLTLWGYAALLVMGVVGFAAFEWGNPATLGGAPWSEKLLGALGGGVFPRTAGFNTVDYAQVRQETLFLDDLLMFVGGGSAGTSGGIKVGTFAVLAVVIWAEVRGEEQAVVGGRAIPQDTVRQAMSIALLSLGVIAGGTFVLLSTTDHPLSASLFEVVSAFGTVGLTTGITPGLPPVAKVTLMALMFVGRVGTVTFASALALNTSHRKFRYPDERPLVG